MTYLNILVISDKWILNVSMYAAQTVREEMVKSTLLLPLSVAITGVCHQAWGFMHARNTLSTDLYPPFNSIDSCC